MDIEELTSNNIVEFLEKNASDGNEENFRYGLESGFYFGSGTSIAAKATSRSKIQILFIFLDHLGTDKSSKLICTCLCEARNTEDIQTIVEYFGIDYNSEYIENVLRTVIHANSDASVIRKYISVGYNNFQKLEKIFCETICYSMIEFVDYLSNNAKAYAFLINDDLKSFERIKNSVTDGDICIKAIFNAYNTIDMGLMCAIDFLLTRAKNFNELLMLTDDIVCIERILNFGATNFSEKTTKLLDTVISLGFVTDHQNTQNCIYLLFERGVNHYTVDDYNRFLSMIALSHFYDVILKDILKVVLSRAKNVDEIMFTICQNYVNIELTEMISQYATNLEKCLMFIICRDKMRNGSSRSIKRKFPYLQVMETSDIDFILSLYEPCDTYEELLERYESTFPPVLK